MEGNIEYIEKLIIKNIINDSLFCTLLSNTAESRFFESNMASEIFSIVSKHYIKYLELPSIDTVINSSKNPDTLKSYLLDVKEITESNDKFIYDVTENWLKESAFKYAILDSVDLVKTNDDITKARGFIETALTKTLKKEIGLNYWGDLSERLKRVFNASDIKIPTGYFQLDEYISGGIKPYTLSVILAEPHSHKSNLMLNIATRMMLSGKNVAYITLEMAEDECANRIDSYLTNLDVNKLYDIQKTDFLKSIKRVASNKSSYGELYIKQYPTSMASCNDIRSYLYELQMRGVNIDVLFVDYLNILGSTKGNTDSLYIDIKRTGEELRALTYPFNLACWTGTQVNRCLKTDSKVQILKNNKIKSINIEDLKINDKIKSNNGFNTVIKIYPKTKQKIYNIKLKNGKSIKCSENHLFPAYDKNNNYIGNFNIMYIKKNNLFLYTE